MAATVSPTPSQTTSKSPLAAKAPAANSSESPGRNGMITSPVSMNTMANRMA